MTKTPLTSTLYFPVSGDPIGFNHLMAAEVLLRAAPELTRVVFILSNGHHPDPTKAGAHAPAAERLEILKTSLAEATDPARSWLARRAEQAGEALHCQPGALAISELELAYPRAVRTAEAVAGLRAQAEATPAERLNLFAGADLVRRMADPAIFSDPDLAELAGSCRYWLLDRDGDSAQAALAQLTAARGLALEARVVPAAGLPEWLSAFLPLASTRIRHAVEAGDPLEGMVTAGAAALIREHALYTDGVTVYHIEDAERHPLGRRSALALALEGLRVDLFAAAAPIAQALTARREAERPATLGIVETACGGNLTWAFAARSGASRFFPQSRFAYDRRAKAALMGGAAAEHSAVSAETVKALAEGMRREAGTDFALAESGMAGPPDGQRHSLKQGECWFALATPDGVHTEAIHLNPFLTRQEHQLHFALHALRWMKGLVG